MSDGEEPSEVAQAAQELDLGDGAPSVEGPMEGPEPLESESEDALSRLWNREPNPPLEAVRGELFNLRDGGLNRIQRGAMKAGIGDRPPAIYDILVGMVEEYIRRVAGVDADLSGLLPSGEDSGEENQGDESVEEVQP